MKPIMFITHFKPCRSGYASYAYNLINSIAKRRPKLPLVVLGCSENISEKSIIEESVGSMFIVRFWSSKIFISDIFEIIHRILKYKPNNVYIHYPLFSTFANNVLNAFANIALLYALIFSTFLVRFKLLINIDEVPKTDASSESKIYFLTLFSPLLILSYLKSNIVVVCWNSIMKILLTKYYQIRGVQIKFIPHGCPPPNLIPSQESNNLKDALGLSGKKIILHLGYISRYKGIDDLIRAFAKIYSEFPEAVLLIAGDYFNPLDKYKPRKHRYFPYLKKLVKDLGLEGRAIFHTFRIPDEYLRLYFTIADIICLPYVTRNISFSGILALAMSYGKPVIVSNCGWFHDVVINRENGLIVPEKDVDALANAIALLLKDDRLRLRLGSNLSYKAFEFSWDNIALSWLKLFNLLNKEHEKISN